VSESDASPVATGDLSGIITDASGNPVPMVNLSLADLPKGAMAGSGGEYSVLDVPAGEHEVMAAYTSGRKTVRVEVLPDRRSSSTSSSTSRPASG
jgi:hypothetical protein